MKKPKTRYIRQTPWLGDAHQDDRRDRAGRNYEGVEHRGRLFMPVRVERAELRAKELWERQHPRTIAKLRALGYTPRRLVKAVEALLDEPQAPGSELPSFVMMPCTNLAFPFTLEVSERDQDVTLKAIATWQGCLGMYERLPTGLRQELKLRGVDPASFADMLLDVIEEAPKVADSPIRVWFLRTPGSLMLRAKVPGASGEPAFVVVFEADMELTIRWYGEEEHTLAWIPVKAVASSYFWSLLPVAAQQFLSSQGVGPEAFSAVVDDLWWIAIQETDPHNYASVVIGFPEEPEQLQTEPVTGKIVWPRVVKIIRPPLEGADDNYNCRSRMLLA